MAITGTFLADFSSFHNAVQKAEVSLKSFEGNAGKVEKAVDRVSNSLSGTKIVQEATIAAKAIEQIGGVSKLTEAELRRVGATAAEAAAKLKAMGQDVPKSIQNIADAAGNLTPKLTMADKAAGLLKSTFAQFTLAGLATNAIQSLITKTGEFIATGQKLPAVEASFGRLTASMKQDGEAMLSNMTKATMGLVSNYDLMLTANKAMLLGLPVTSESMGELAKAATTLGRAMGKDATSSIDDLITALGRSSPMILDNLGLTVKVGEANEAYAAKLGKTVEQLTDAEKKMAFYEAAMEAARRKTKELGEQTKTLGEIAEAVWVKVGNTVSGAVGLINTQIGKALSTKDAFIDLLKAVAVFGNAGSALVALQERDANRRPRGGDVNLPSPEAAKAQADYVAQLAKVRIEVAALTGEQRKQIAAAQALGESTEKITKQFGISEMVLKVLALTYKDAKTSAAALAEEYKKNLKAVKDSEDAWNKLLSTIKLNNDLMALTDEALTKVSRSSIDAKVAQAQLRGTLHDSAVQWLANAAATDTARKLSETYAFGGWFQQTAKIPPVVKEITVNFGALSQALANLAQISGGSLGAVAQGLSQIVGAVDAAKKGIETFSKGMEAFKSGSTLAGIAGMSTGIMGIVTAAMAAAKAIGAIWNAFDRNKGRDLVKDFAESFGGFDALHNQLLTLGDAGEQLWIKLTQGVGRNNPAQAEKVIAEVEEALAKQKAAQDAATVSTEAGAQATIETATQAALALDELNGRLKTNADAWGEWSEDVTGFLQKLANDIRAMPLPGPSGVVSGTGTLNRGGGTLSGGSAVTSGGGGTAILSVDGRILAEVMVPHVPGVVSDYRLS